MLHDSAEAAQPSLAITQIASKRSDRIVHRLAWSREGIRLAMSSFRGRTLRIWDVNTGAVEEQQLPVAALNVVWVGIDVLAVYTTDRVVVFWDTRGRQLVGSQIPGVTYLPSYACSPDGKRLILEQLPGSVILRLDGTTHVHIPSKMGSPGTGPLGNIAWSPDSSMFISTGLGGAHLSVWSAQSGEQLDYIHTKHRMYTAAWAPSGQVVATGGSDKKIRLWDFDTKEQIGVFKGHTKAVKSLSFSHDGQFLVSQAQNDAIIIWACSSGEIVSSFDVYQQDARMHRTWQGPVFHPSYPLLATVDGLEHVANLWEFGNASAVPFAAARYTTAKVVLMGDTGVGKTSCSAPLSDRRQQAVFMSTTEFAGSRRSRVAL